MSLLKEIAFIAATSAVGKAGEIKKDIEKNGLDFIKCPHCGSLVRVNKGHEIVFCNKCNSKLVVQDIRNASAAANKKSAAVPKIKFCPNCGNKLDPQAKFCSACGTSISNTFMANHNSNNTEVKNNTESKPITTCPYCNGPVDSFSPDCPHCGRTIHRDQTSYATACQQLSRRLDEIERSRSTRGLVSTVSDLVSKSNFDLNSIDKQKLEAINGFIIPNTKDDIIEFLLLVKARTAMNPEISYDLYDMMSSKTLYGAWVSKAKQVIEKADLILSSDSDYLKIRGEALKQVYRVEGRCQHCGGKLKGVISQVCSDCGLKRDYKPYSFSKL